MCLECSRNSQEVEMTLSENKRVSRDNTPEVRKVRQCMALGTLRTLAFTLSEMGFPGDSGGKESACNAGDPGLIPGSGRSPGEEMATHSRILTC